MNIIVAGAGGFLGSHLCETLLKQGHHVIGIDNFLTGQRGNISLIQKTWSDNFTFIEQDVCTPSQILPDMDVQQVYYLASPASPIDYVQVPLETLYVVSFGCRNYLEIAQKHNARFLLTSTSEVYGDPLVHPQPEDYWGLLLNTAKQIADDLASGPAAV